ncbi:MAG TPA: hypothetical protein PKA30_15790 [Accumulibacter sp.]|nr:hypothetical protein [Accumulibacter sp.]HMV06993.1 hypothetical protein [Accumulibacter sp.]HNN85705.1 hypothetical protein [Accumulibacter sp.]
MESGGLRIMWENGMNPLQRALIEQAGESPWLPRLRARSHSHLSTSPART